MAFSIAAGLAGFAKRGMQFNDEQRQMTNENIKQAVNLVATDALTQRAARKKIKNEYIQTAESMKSMGMNDVQIEAAYAALGNNAYTKISENLQDAKNQYALSEKKAGRTGDWTTQKTQEWLQSQFIIPDGATGRSIQEQAQARVDTLAPMTTADFGALAQGIVAGSGEITMRPSDRRAETIRNQMEASFAAASGGIKETADGAVFNPSGAQLNLQATTKEQLAARQLAAQTEQAEANVDLTNVQIDNFGLEQVQKIQNIELARKQNPLLIKQLEAAIANSKENTRGLSLANAITEATKGETIASKLLETVIKEIQVEAGQLSNAQAKLDLAQDPVLFAKQMEELGVRIEGIRYDNYKKKIENQDVAFMAELSKELKIIEVEQSGLRRDLVREQIIAARAKNPLEEKLLKAQVEAAQNKNSLFGLEQDQLEATLRNLEARTEQTIAQTDEIGKDKTYQAALVEVNQAIAQLEADQNNMPADVFNQKMIALTGTQSRLTTGLLAYTDATDTSSTTPISFTSLVNGYNKGLMAKLSAAGVNVTRSGQGYTVQRDGQGNVTGISYNREQLADNVKAVIDEHESSYRQMLQGQTFGDEAIAALFGSQQAAAAQPQLPVITIENGEATIPAGVKIGDRVQSADGEVRIYNGPDADPMFSPVE